MAVCFIQTADDLSDYAAPSFTTFTSAFTNASIVTWYIVDDDMFRTERLRRLGNATRPIFGLLWDVE